MSPRATSRHTPTWRRAPRDCCATHDACAFISRTSRCWYICRGECRPYTPHTTFTANKSNKLYIHTPRVSSRRVPGILFVCLVIIVDPSNVWLASLESIEILQQHKVPTPATPAQYYCAVVGVHI